MTCAPSSPFGCVTSWEPPINIYGSGDMGQHVCDLASRHRGPHKCRCGAEHKDESEDRR